MVKTRYIIAGMGVLIVVGGMSAMEGGSIATAQSEMVTIIPSSGTFGRFYGDTEITAETLVKLAPEPSDEAKQFVLRYKELFVGLTAMPETLSDLIDRKKRAELLSDKKSILSTHNLTNLSKNNYAIPAGGLIYKVAGMANKAHLIKADNDCYGMQLTSEQWNELNIPDHTYQTPSSVAYGLLAHQAIDRKGLHGIKIPATTLVHWSFEHPDDTNCVVVQEWVPGTLEAITLENRSLITDVQIDNMAQLIIEAGLWSISGNLKLRKEDRQLVDTDLEQPNNEQSINFFHKWSLKRNWNTSVGLEEFASHFKGEPEKIDLIKIVAERSGFFARFALTHTKEGLAQHVARLDAYKRAE